LDVRRLLCVRFVVYDLHTAGHRRQELAGNSGHVTRQAKERVRKPQDGQSVGT